MQKEISKTFSSSLRIANELICQIYMLDIDHPASFLATSISSFLQQRHYFPAGISKVWYNPSSECWNVAVDHVWLLSVSDGDVLCVCRPVPTSEAAEVFAI